MKVQYMSDLHLEFGNMEIPTAVGDVLVLAGDIGVGDSAVDWINMAADKFKDIIYILGNHEFYHNDMPMLIAKLRKHGVFAPNVHFLNNETITIDRVKFAATTLWSDIHARAFDSMNDSRIINYSGLRMRHHKVKGMFHENKLFLDANADADVFITHHCPHIKSINTSRYPDSSMNTGYYTDILGDYEGSNVKHWICGHTHSATEYTEHGIQVHNNCRGYVSRYSGEPEVLGFNPEAVFEVEGSNIGVPKDMLW